MIQGCGGLWEEEMGGMGNCSDDREGRGRETAKGCGLRGQKGG